MKYFWLIFIVTPSLFADTGEWVLLNDAIEGAYGQAVVSTSERMYLFSCYSAGSRTFVYEYDQHDDTWDILSLSGDYPHYGMFRNGTAVDWDRGDYFYILCGARYYEDPDRREFWRLQISTGRLEKVADSPHAQGAGDAISWCGRDNFFYALIGSSGHDSAFAKYNPSDNVWISLPNAPAFVDDGCSLTWAGKEYLYALRGEFEETDPLTTFWRYHLDNVTWDALADIPDPGGVGDGGSLLWIGDRLSTHRDYLYALGGGSCNEDPGILFLRYDINYDSWQNLATLPFGVGEYNGNRLCFGNERIHYCQISNPDFPGEGKKIARFESEEFGKDTGCEIIMPFSYYSAGDMCYCYVNSYHRAPAECEVLRVFALLECYGNYFFAPSYSNDIDSYYITVLIGQITDETFDPLPAFSWPANVGLGSATWYAAIADEAITEIRGEIATFDFHWE
ncbi:hypothetical protein ACFL2B_00730 [Patescibacteria group bacterium]